MGRYLRNSQTPLETASNEYESNKHIFANITTKNEYRT